MLYVRYSSSCACVACVSAKDSGYMMKVNTLCIVTRGSHKLRLLQNMQSYEGYLSSICDQEALALLKIEDQFCSYLEIAWLRMPSGC